MFSTETEYIYDKAKEGHFSFPSRSTARDSNNNKQITKNADFYFIAPNKLGIVTPQYIN